MTTLRFPDGNDVQLDAGTKAKVKAVIAMLGTVVHSRSTFTPVESGPDYFMIPERLEVRRNGTIRVYIRYKNFHRDGENFQASSIEIREYILTPIPEPALNEQE